ARCGAAPYLDERRPAQVAEAAPDNHRVGIDTGGDLVRSHPGHATLAGQRHPDEHVHGDRQPAVRAHDVTASVTSMALSRPPGRHSATAASAAASPRRTALSM